MIVRRDIAEKVNEILDSKYIPKKHSYKLIRKFTEICNSFEELQREFLNINNSILRWTSVDIWLWYIDQVIMRCTDVLVQLNDKETEIAYEFKSHVISVDKLDSLLSKGNKFLLQLKKNVRNFFEEFNEECNEECNKKNISSSLQATWQKTCHLLGKKDFRFLYADIVSIKVVMQTFQRYKYVVDVALKKALPNMAVSHRVKHRVKRAHAHTVIHSVPLPDLPPVVSMAECTQLEKSSTKSETELIEQVAVVTTKARATAEVLKRERAECEIREQQHNTQRKQYAENIVNYKKEVDPLQLKLAVKKDTHSQVLMQQKLVHTRQLAELQDQYKKVQAERTSLLRQQAEQEQTKKRLDELEQQVVVIQAKADTYKKQLEVVKAEAEEYKEECTKLREQKLFLQQEVGKATKDVERYHKDKLAYLKQQDIISQFFNDQLSDFMVMHEEQVRILQTRLKEKDLMLRFARLKSGDTTVPYETETEEQDKDRLLAKLVTLPPVSSKITTNSGWGSI